MTLLEYRRHWHEAQDRYQDDQQLVAHPGAAAHPIVLIDDAGLNFEQRWVASPRTVSSPKSASSPRPADSPDGHQRGVRSQH